MNKKREQEHLSPTHQQHQMQNQVI